MRKKPENEQLPLFAELPVVGDHAEKVVGVVELPVVDGVAGNGHADRNQPGNVREAVVAGAEQGQLMTAQIELAKSVQLVLLAMFQAIEESVAERDLAGNPRVGLRIAGTPAADQVRIAIVSRELEKAIEALPGNVGGSEIDRVVSLANIECAAVHRDAFDRQRNQDIRIGVTVAVSVGGQIVGIQKVADLEKLARWARHGRRPRRERNTAAP